jgi:hypothetical protein
MRLDLNGEGNARSEFLGGSTPPLGQGRPRGKTLETISMERTGARERIIRMTRNSQMADLRMDQTVHGLSIDHSPATNASPDRDIQERLETAPGSPAALTEGGTVDIRIEPDGNAKGFIKAWHDFGAGPPRFRSSQD